MEVKGLDENYSKFLKEIVNRGLGIYGPEKMAKICYESDVALMDDNSLDFLSENYKDSVSKLIENYSKINLSAKMTALILAKRYNIPIPDSLKKKKKKSRFLGRFRRGN